jgi:hypothetical protein
MTKTRKMTLEFDTSGMVETSIDWQLMGEPDRLYMRTKVWWESLLISYANSCSSATTEQH